ncbi:MAG: helix-turn-helix transcriptional regulator [Actinobacteria bacterium]|nr:helix-turn-helix transcriptional regulator [Actinomycetota bacterium]
MPSGPSLFGTVLASARRQRGMSLADLAGATYVSRGWINNVEAGRRWPAREWVERVERILQSSGRLLLEWEQGERARAVEDESRELLKQSERESELLLAAQPDAVELDRLDESVADLAAAYLANPARPMLEQGMALRRELSRRLKLGAVRPNELSDLYIALGPVCGILAYAAVDLGDSGAARVHGEAAWRMADITGDNELRAWSRGTQSLIYRFEKM